MNKMVGWLSRGSLIVLIVLCGLCGTEAAALAQEVRRQPPRGPVRIRDHAVADEDGPFNALGATLFWGAWGYKFDRARLERNLEILSDAGVDYVRVLGSVGGGTWTEQQTDPRWADYDAVVAGLTDLVYDQYGMRVQWTLLGGAPFTPLGSAREALVDRFGRLGRGREHKIFAFEIANEARRNGFEGHEGRAELRRLGMRLNKQTSVLVALSDPGANASCETYAGVGVDVATMHYERGFGSTGPTAPMVRPWGYPSAYDARCRGQLPAAVFNNEPIGPESSVQRDAAASRIAAGYVLTFLAKNAAYVFHAGPGIRGAEMSSPLRRHANFDEMPSFGDIANALSAARGYLPAGLANWTRHEARDKTAPIQGFKQAYSATSGSRFVVLAVGVRRSVKVRAQTNSSIEMRDPATGNVVNRVTVKAGQWFSVGGYPLLVLIGRA